MNIIVQLWDQLIECSLLGFHAAFLARFDGGNDRSKLTDLDNTLIEVVFVFLLDLKLELGQGIIDLAIEIDHVTHVLEVLVNVIKVTGLLHELVNIFDLLRQVGNALAKPLLFHISPLADHLRDKSLDLANEVFGSRQQCRAATLRIDLEQTNISHRGQVRIEKGVVVVEELNSMSKGLCGVSKSLVDKQREICLLVSPVNFE